MKDDDITFSVGLDISDAETTLNQLDTEIGDVLSKESDSTVRSPVSAITDIGEGIKPKTKSLKDSISRAVEEAWGDISLKLNPPTPWNQDADYDIHGLTKVYDPYPPNNTAPGPQVIDYTDKAWNGEEFALDMGKTKDVDLSDFNADNLKNKWSQEGSDAYARLNLQLAKRAAKADFNFAKGNNKIGYYDEDEARSAAERFAKADGALQADRRNKNTTQEEVKQHEVTDETKAQNREYTEQILKLGKLRLLLDAMKSALSGMKRIWGEVADVSQKVKTDTGFITKDVNLFGKSSTDRSLRITHEALRAYGDNAPFSVSAFDNLMASLEKVSKEVLMGGKADNAKTVAIQWLSDATGWGMNAKSLLAGDDKTMYEKLLDIMQKAEEYISNPAFYQQSQQKIRQDMHNLEVILGPEILDAIASNAAINQKLGSSVDLMTRVNQAGAAGVVNTNQDINTRKVNESLALLNSEVDILKNKILDALTPAIVTVTKKLEGFIAFLNRFIPSETEEQKEARKELDQQTAQKVREGRKAGRISTHDPMSPYETFQQVKVRSNDTKEESKSAAKLRKDLHNNSAEYNAILNNPSAGAYEMFKALVMTNSDVGGIKWVNRVEQGVGLRALFETIKNGGIMEDNPMHPGQKRTKDYGNDILNELASIIAAAFDRESFEAMSADNLQRAFMGWVQSNTNGNAIAFYNKYFNEGGELDLKDAENGAQSIAEYPKQVLDALGGTPEAILAFLKTLDDFAKASGSKFMGATPKEVTQLNGQYTLHITLDTTNVNGQSFETSIPIDSRETAENVMVQLETGGRR